MRFFLAVFLLALAGCNQKAPPAADPDLSAEIQRIRAIDNHAHPVRFTAQGEPPDRFFDALPVDNMEPQSDPVNLRPNAPSIAAAWRGMYGADHVDQARKQSLMGQKGTAWPTWALDQMGIEIMLANRVEMWPGESMPLVAFPVGSLCRRADLSLEQLLARRQLRPQSFLCARRQIAHPIFTRRETLRASQDA